MKRLFIIITAALALCAVSCDKENMGALYEGESAFSFASGVLNVEVCADDNGDITVPVYRSGLDVNGVGISFSYDISPEGSAEPKWVDVDPNGLFSLNSKRVTFADGEYVAYARIHFSDLEKLGITDKYKMRLTLNDGVSPSQKGTTVITASRKLTFKKFGDFSFRDYMIFENAYDVVLMKADEGEIYRIMKPYDEGFVAEEYYEMGWVGDTPDYVQFRCDAKGHITFQEFQVGMKLETVFMTWAYYPSDYKWGADFSDKDVLNQKISDDAFDLCAVYCLPEFQYGYLNEGASMIELRRK